MSLIIAIDRVAWESRLVVAFIKEVGSEDSPLPLLLSVEAMENFLSTLRAGLRASPVQDFGIEIQGEEKLLEPEPFGGERPTGVGEAIAGTYADAKLIDGRHRVLAVGTNSTYWLSRALNPRAKPETLDLLQGIDRLQKIELDSYLPKLDHESMESEPTPTCAHVNPNDVAARRKKNKAARAQRRKARR